MEESAMSLDRLLKLQSQKKDSGGPSPSEPAKAPAPEPSSENSMPVGENPAAVPAPVKRLPFGNNAPKPKPAAPAPKPAAKPSATLDFDLDNLGSLDLSEVMESEPADTSEYSGFFDEIEATAPDRALDPELEAGAKGFVELLDSIYLILNDPEMFGQSVRTVMMELQENPEYTKLISDTDVHVMIRAMRNTMGLARIRKQAKSRKTSTASSRAKTPSKKQALMDKALGLTIGMDID